MVIPKSVSLFVVESRSAAAYSPVGANFVQETRSTEQTNFRIPWGCTPLAVGPGKRESGYSIVVAVEREGFELRGQQSLESLGRYCEEFRVPGHYREWQRRLYLPCWRLRS